MSTFKVRLNGSEFEGGKLAAKEYNRLYPDFSTGALSPSELFEKWIKTLVKTANVVVTYGINDWPVSLDGQDRLIATPTTGRTFRLKLRSDDDNFGLRKVVMITPSQKPELNEQYLSDIVTRIKNAAQETDAMAYLLGTILLRRCR
ncbi:hypothetical protein SAMN05892877_107272 [Rhizobium subbaraonis]|uniref:Uncharacterized protein n=1 Tax=Rhizobium subbaraonis TaxID=908946 RepID=A0A285UGI3_9HYPH|nr:hypothetical protein [Rhizobium subbaraonis]SOC40518.1 hypothetical protein SAMN05892877_107272 [Rhizobium subbaraonis]